MALTTKEINYAEVLDALRTNLVDILTNYLSKQYDVQRTRSYKLPSGKEQNYTSRNSITRNELLDTSTVLMRNSLSTLNRNRANTALKAARRLHNTQINAESEEEAAGILNQFKEIINTAVSENDLHSIGAGKTHQTSTTQRNSHWYQHNSESVENYDHLRELIAYAEKQLNINPANANESVPVQQNLHDRKSTCSLL